MTADGHIYLIDFGLSIQLSERQEFAQSFVGSPLYIVPERFVEGGLINYKADIYGVGSIFYFMLHGEAPYQSEAL
jgi:serine/threonine protein kinase